MARLDKINWTGFVQFWVFSEISAAKCNRNTHSVITITWQRYLIYSHVNSLNLTLVKIAIWLSKNCQNLKFFPENCQNWTFFQKVAQNCHFFPKKLPLTFFLEKMTILGNLWTVKWQFSGGSALHPRRPQSDTRLGDWPNQTVNLSPHQLEILSSWFII